MRRLLALPLCLAALAALPALAAAAGHGPGARADLLVTGNARTPAAAASGETVKLHLALRNRGGADAGASRYAVYLAKNATHTGADRQLVEPVEGKIAAGSSVPVNVSVKLPAAAPGTYRLITCADAAQQVAESNEQNNCMSSPRFALSGDPGTVLIGVRGSFEGPLPAPEAQEDASFEFDYGTTSSGGLTEPVVTFTLPKNTRLVSVTLGGAAVSCVGPSGNRLVCEPPSGSGDPETKLVVTVLPFEEAIGEALTLTGYVEAFESVRSYTLTLTSPTVEP